MDLWIIVIILLVISIVLLLWSFFAKSNTKHLKEEFEEFSLELLQDNYDLKKRISVIEAKLNITSEEISTSTKIHDILKKHVITLYTQGIPVEDIANQTRLSKTTVQVVVNEYVENN